MMKMAKSNEIGCGNTSAQSQWTNGIKIVSLLNLDIFSLANRLQKTFRLSSLDKPNLKVYNNKYCDVLISSLVQMPSKDPQPTAIADLRCDYRLKALLETEVNANPIQQFQLWFDQAIQAELPEPNAMTLATVSTAGKPAARMVLLKGVDSAGFVFYTNYQSRKGQELTATPWAALVFWWAELERQVRIEGPVSKVSDTETETYFYSRPRGSQLGAWASDQSQVIGDRTILEQRLQDLEQQYQNQPIPRPSHWGGYRLQPDLIEFWQGRPNRLHDRLSYQRQNEAWTVQRLSP